MSFEDYGLASYRDDPDPLELEADAATTPNGSGSPTPSPPTTNPAPAPNATHDPRPRTARPVLRSRWRSGRLPPCRLGRARHRHRAPTPRPVPHDPGRRHDLAARTCRRHPRLAAVSSVPRPWRTGPAWSHVDLLTPTLERFASPRDSMGGGERRRRIGTHAEHVSVSPAPCSASASTAPAISMSNTLILTPAATAPPSSRISASTASATGGASGRTPTAPCTGRPPLRGRPHRDGHGLETRLARHQRSNSAPPTPNTSAPNYSPG